MLENHGVERNSIIVGSSVHMQSKIERLWRDMHHCVTSSTINPINEMHIMVLHILIKIAL